MKLAVPMNLTIFKGGQLNEGFKMIALPLLVDTHKALLRGLSDETRCGTYYCLVDYFGTGNAGRLALEANVPMPQQAIDVLVNEEEEEDKKRNMADAEWAPEDDDEEEIERAEKRRKGKGSGVVWKTPRTPRGFLT